MPAPPATRNSPLSVTGAGPGASAGGEWFLATTRRLCTWGRPAPPRRKSQRYWDDSAQQSSELPAQTVVHGPHRERQSRVGSWSRPHAPAEVHRAVNLTHAAGTDLRCDAVRSKRLTDYRGIRCHYARMVGDEGRQGQMFESLARAFDKIGTMQGRDFGNSFKRKAFSNVGVRPTALASSAIGPMRQPRVLASAPSLQEPCCGQWPRRRR